MICDGVSGIASQGQVPAAAGVEAQAAAGEQQVLPPPMAAGVGGAADVQVWFLTLRVNAVTSCSAF